ncbi:hypothetical protein NE237_000776 [Protea cynaroides]|uniref:Uncharacterized protein n=1 Tax=Protea cynaroides TaxID=273540 RepID=A0A9Q0QXG4_9MAGN|nr:hypothetical protein NE237_000776 [Protea cynaroides]
MYYKEEALKEIEKYFKFDGDDKRYILSNLGHMWSDYKGTLRKKTIESFRNIRNAPRPMFPIEIPEDQWKHLIDRWSSLEFVAKSEKNKECRKKQKLPHTIGRTSFPQTSHLMSLEMPDGRQPSRVELFERTHKRKNGSYIDQDSIEVMEKLEQKLDEQPPDSRNDKSVQDDVYMQVMGPERNGRVWGVGRVVAPSDVGLARTDKNGSNESPTKGNGSIESPDDTNGSNESANNISNPGIHGEKHLSEFNSFM